MNETIKKAGALWSHTHNCWHVPLSKQWYQAIEKACEQRAVIDRTALNAYLHQHREATLPQPAETKTALTPQELRIKQLAGLAKQPPRVIKANGHAWLELRKYIIAEALSVNTIRNYLTDFGLYLKWLGNRDANLLGKATVIEYMVYCMEQEGLSNSTANCRLNAINPVGSK